MRSSATPRESAEPHLKDCLLAALNGDEQAYRHFLETAAKLLRSYLSDQLPAKIRRKELVEDLVQDVLLAIHRKRQTFRKDAAVLPWIFAIARYRWIDHARALKIRPEVLAWPAEDESPEDWLERNAEHHQPQDYDPERALVRTDVQTLMADLNPRQRELIRLVKLEEHSLDEAAEKLDMSLVAVKVGVHRALKRMHEQLEKRRR